MTDTQRKALSEHMNTLKDYIASLPEDRRAELRIILSKDEPQLPRLPLAELLLAALKRVGRLDRAPTAVHSLREDAAHDNSITRVLALYGTLLELKSFSWMLEPLLREIISLSMIIDGHLKASVAELTDYAEPDLDDPPEPSPCTLDVDDDFDNEPLPTRTCNLDDDECESCQ